MVDKDPQQTHRTLHTSCNVSTYILINTERTEVNRF